MKLIVSFFLFFFAGFVHAEIKPKLRPDTGSCLQIEGRITNVDIDGGSCKVELLLNDVVIDSVILKSHRKKFRFNFVKNQHYTIRISKNGFQTKSVCVHTQMEGIDNTIYQFYFETALVLAKDPTVITAPIATIYFNARKKCFYYVRSRITDAIEETCRSLPDSFGSYRYKNCKSCQKTSYGKVFQKSAGEG